MLLSSRRHAPRHLVLPESSQHHLAIRHFLLHSPLPSPALPSIVPRHGKKPSQFNPWRTLRYICWAALMATVWLALERITRRVADPTSSSLRQLGQQGDTSMGELPPCQQTLTYVLDASQAGLGQALMGMWMSYGLAKREKRALFVDESHFPFGKITDILAAHPDSPACHPPQQAGSSTYSHHTKHLTVHSGMLDWTFGEAFERRFSNKQIFSMAREGYEALFRLRPADEAIVQGRLLNLRQSIDEQGSLVGVHIRRGDRRPSEFQYQHAYLPLSKYMSAADERAQGHQSSRIIVASDDVDVHSRPELEGTEFAQQQIKLANKEQRASGGLGWEGGFFSGSFWSAGLPESEKRKRHLVGLQPTKAQRPIVSSHAMEDHSGASGLERDYKADPTPEALRLRRYVARSYILDLAVLARADDIVCGVSSTGCRMLGVMTGWDNVQSGRWKNIDGDSGWKAVH